MDENVLNKLKILAESAKYDVSCSSSGTVRSGKAGMLGNTVGGWGICHSFAEDGRCISLLKVMLTNYCIYDCAYCINRRSNDLPRATLSVAELVDLTMEFYRRNYIEGLFLSSGVVRNPDYTMERLVRVAKDLRTIHRFNGYIHLKSIPGASRELVNEAGLYADRLSVNVEIPKEENLKLLAPEKDHKSVYAPMRYIQQGVLESSEERKKHRHAPRFAPAGQSTQMIVGATAETDKDILYLSSALYKGPTMRRVYYSHPRLFQSLTHIVGRAADKGVFALYLIQLGQCRFYKRAGSTQEGNHPHPEYSARTAYCNGGGNPCKIARTYTAGNGDGKCLER